MSLSSSCRRLSVAPLAGVERQGRGSMGGGGSEVGVLCSLPLRASTSCGAHPFSVLQPHLHQGQGLGEGGSVSCRERSSRANGGTRSPVLNSIAQRILRWAEKIELVLAPQFIQGKNNVLADSLSRPNQIQGSECILKREVFQELNNKWPVMINLFGPSLNYRCSLYFSPFHDPSAISTDALLQNWDGYQVYAFTPWSMIPLVLKKLRSSSGVLMTLIAPFWPQRPWFPDLLDLVVDGPISLPNCRDLLSQPHFHCHHLGTDKLSLRAWRLSSDLLDPKDSPLE